jgi:hypothetical protein
MGKFGQPSLVIFLFQKTSLGDYLWGLYGLEEEDVIRLWDFGAKDKIVEDAVWDFEYALHNERMRTVQKVKSVRAEDEWKDRAQRQRADLDRKETTVALPADLPQLPQNAQGHGFFNALTE